MAKPVQPLHRFTSSRKSAASSSRKTGQLGVLQGDLPLEERRAEGRKLRDVAPRDAHGVWSRNAKHSGAVMQSNEGRQPQLVPLRMARMTASPFSFYRGAAAVMAYDLAAIPVTGIHAVLDGEAHLNSFGLYGTPQRDVVFDLNDFCETVIGPWEWDLKRLTASVNLAGRENGLSRAHRDAKTSAVARKAMNVDRTDPQLLT